MQQIPAAQVGKILWRYSRWISAQAATWQYAGNYCFIYCCHWL